MRLLTAALAALAALAVGARGARVVHATPPDLAAMWLAGAAELDPAFEPRANVHRLDAAARQPLQENDNAQRRAAPAPGAERREPYPSGGLTFYETYFSGSSLAIWWNPRNDAHVLAFVDNHVHASNDGGRIFVDLVETDGLSGARDRQPAVYDNSPYYGVRGFTTSPADANVLMLFGYGNLIWVSIDGGATFVHKTIPLYPRDWEFHPTRRDWIVVLHVDASCYTAQPTTVCSYELWLSRDIGDTWVRLSTHVSTFAWSAWNDGDGDAHNSLFAHVITDRTKNQVQYDSTQGRLVNVNGNAKRDLQRVDLGAAGTGQMTLVASDVYQLVMAGEYLFSVRPDASATGISIWVSALGNAFGRASFATDHAIGVLTIHDVSDGGVILIERPSFSPGPYLSGYMWVSDGHGLIYSLALKDVIFLSVTWASRYAVHKVQSMEATHIATLNGNNRLKSLITWDKGAVWNTVRTQDALDGKFDDTNHPLIFYGATHSTTYNSHRGFYSAETAPGLILAVGSEDITLDEYENVAKDGDMYFSRNGGLSFRKVLDGTYFCRFIDEGGLIVCMSIDETDTLMYTLDEASTSFVSVKMTPSAIDPRLLLSDPDWTSTYMMSAGWEVNGGRFMIVSVDLAPLLPRTCKATDYELWTPSDGRLNGRCVLGHQITYQRLKVGAACTSTLDAVVSVNNNCSCARSDFECAFGYTYHPDGQTCELASSSSSSAANAELVCTNGYYVKPSGYRRVPGDTCDPSLSGSVDWAAPQSTPCPVDQDLKQLATILGVSITVLALVVLGFVLFIWWKRKALYASYRNLPTNELQGGELGELNGPHDAQADDEADAAEMNDDGDGPAASTAHGGKLQI